MLQVSSVLLLERVLILIWAQRYVKSFSDILVEMKLLFHDNNLISNKWKNRAYFINVFNHVVFMGVLNLAAYAIAWLHNEPSQLDIPSTNM